MWKTKPLQHKDLANMIQSNNTKSENLECAFTNSGENTFAGIERNYEIGQVLGRKRLGMQVLRAGLGADGRR